MTSGAKSMPGAIWAVIFLCTKSRSTPLLMRCVLASSLLSTRAGNDLADAACNLVVLAHGAPPFIRAVRCSANLAVTSMAHWIARVGFARQRLDVDAVWIS